MTNQNLFAMPARVDSNTADAVREDIFAAIQPDADLILDFKETAYISSAGLRVVLTAQKKMKALGLELSLRNVKQQILEIFELTGLAGVIKIV
ncbi:MAG: STAS domain-containing protein [Peptococcaceae bacterium]|jgi:anti-anti-sigma factor|nr:STAS domain-containing protein [Peptococcaceae bacterium]